METEYIYEADLNTFEQGGGDGNEDQVQGHQNADVDSVTAAAVAGIAEEMSAEVDGTMDVDSSEIIAAGVVDGGMISTDHHISSLMGHSSSHAPHLEVEISTEDQLKSVERLDRSSPDLWPQNLPTAAQHIIAKNSIKSGQSEQPLGIWAQGLDPEDINLLHQFGSLTSSSLVEEVKKLQNIAYQLGLEEAKEMTRGRLLHVLDENDILTSASEQARYLQSLWK